MKNWTFYRQLHGRGLTVAKLAQAIASDRSHLNRVLNNHEGRGGYTRKKLFRLLTYDEIKALGWWDEFMNWLEDTGRVPKRRLEPA